MPGGGGCQRQLETFPSSGAMAAAGGGGSTVGIGGPGNIEAGIGRVTGTDAACVSAGAAGGGGATGGGIGAGGGIAAGIRGRGGGRAAMDGGGAGGRGGSTATGDGGGSVWLLTQEPISAASSATSASPGITHSLRFALLSLTALSAILLAPTPAPPSAARTARARPAPPLAR